MIRWVGVDIGGSGARAATVTGGMIGPILGLPHDRSVADVVRTVGALTDALGADALAVGVPGRVRDGVVVSSVNLGWRDVPLARALAERARCPVMLTNDADAATWGAWLGTDRRDLVLLTLGTGVGGGIVAHGALVRGTGAAGEVGHIYVGGDRRCACGGAGCLETWCSTTGLTRSATERGHPAADGRAVVHAAHGGEAWAMGALTDAGRALGRALGTLVNLLAPAHLVVVGGLADAAPIRREAERVLDAAALPEALIPLARAWGGRADPWVIRGAVALAQGGAPYP